MTEYANIFKLKIVKSINKFKKVTSKDYKILRISN